MCILLLFLLAFLIGWPSASCRGRQTLTQYFCLHKDRLVSREMTLIDGTINTILIRAICS